MKRFSAPPALGSPPPPPPTQTSSPLTPPLPLTDDITVTFPAPSSPTIRPHPGKGWHPSPHQYNQHHHRQQQQQHQVYHHHHKQSSHHHHHHHILKHQALLHHPPPQQQQQHQPQQQQQQHQQYDLGKRVKTEQTFESLFDKETHSDVTVNVNRDEYVFHAHRMILVMKSEVFAAMLSQLDNKPDIEITVSAGRSDLPPVLHVQEDAQCGQVFSRFLYFLYSGSVWLHPDYVLPLFRLGCKYQVKSLREHCQAYILQVLAKSCRTPSSGGHPQNSNSNNNNNNSNNSVISHNHCPSNVNLTPSPNANSPPYMGNGFSLDVVCDLYEDQLFEGDVQQTSYRLLCCQFRQLVRTERWQRCSVRTVCSLISGDNCNVEENLILMSATDYMKRNNLSDKKQIEDILSLIRYPRLNRRVLYHLQKNGSFKNFPHIQQLMVRALMYHSFKDLPEAKDDFVGTQFRPRMSNNTSPNRRASMHVATCGVSDGHPEETDLSDSDYSLDPLPCIAVAEVRQSQV